MIWDNNVKDKKYDAVVCGYLGVDLAPGFFNTRENINSVVFFKPGSLTEVGDMSISLGGVVANTGVALKIFDQRVLLMGMIGNDFLGGIAVSCDNCHDATDLLQWPHDPSATWLIPGSVNFHGDEANTDSTLCARCHGANFLGGSTGVSCLSCHFDESGALVPPGSSWTHGDDHDTLLVYGSVCNNCHDTWRTYDAASAPAACHDCHGGGATHEIGDNWLLPSQHVNASNTDRNACLNCHAYTSGGIQPDCQDCHQAAVPPLTTGNCNSCHGSGANAGSSLAGYPNGSSYPNRRGRHDGNHDEFACSICHTGYGSGSLLHWDRSYIAPANVQLAPSTSSISFNATNATCTGTCHYGSGGTENHGTNEQWY